ncbi:MULTISPECIES: mechanosensitive ion channel family protein [Sphingobacterium]|uniref:mechanosensitive ion channel family protein n=1 Tax=Sphingobacterium TaxID=28453 RepID=UPI0019356A15|nr:mechanosensitive ion channel domain-containing protein [Sphingobacterium sp. UDSM-2020]QQD12173.1 mechanosensitive ion channel [Sphingobacterium sp. UDSM-2020]
MQNEQLNTFENKAEKFVDSAISYAPSIISAILSAVLILFLGLWLIKMIKKLIDKIFIKRNVDPSIRVFLGSIVNWILKILLFIVVVSQLGVQTSTFIAVIGAAGLAIGLSLQGSLSNFAGGVLILLFKPFKAGDYISSSTGVSGTVKVIDIFNTRLITPQNQLIVIPNGELSNSNITNYTELQTRRTWFDIGISYNADLRKTKTLLLEVIRNNEFAYSEPAPDVVVTNLGDSAVNLSIRVTTSNENFWAMQEQLIIDCKDALDKEGIEIPYPQQDVHLRQ